LVDEFGRHRDGKFENISLDDSARPTSLIRQYDNIYSDERVELLDVLEHDAEGHGDQGHTEFNAKSLQLPVSILVVSSVAFVHTI